MDEKFRARNSYMLQCTEDKYYSYKMLIIYWKEYKISYNKI